MRAIYVHSALRTYNVCKKNSADVVPNSRPIRQTLVLVGCLTL